MYEFLIISYLIIAIVIIGLVLIQRGKGADMGSSFGAGASATLFGSSGSGNFLTRATTLLGILFFVISVFLSNLSGKSHTIPTNKFNIIDSSVPAINLLNENNADSVSQPVQQNSTSDIPE
ncbi:MULTISPECIES: preprotein translocase subunit SecG [unclassified Gilliamella]|uniref:preprotein translocase subunit SecG n=1 Tax=unclassified Gilliamella TaxID=2685620 RepID=UPI00130778A5|nr:MULTISPECIES: preprotein translocase subunit SecG [unclassified Gilliamella]MWP50218.1 preprotein translocase subunit SecG [Gilliamella sp. Lep-s35]MWP69951.1 preprotein translocase subunit SecG [Gilliamella sp. Lep-s5]MWP78219.1 preprotein translocase subunit SecG [Gilliamella sp. Lep-s21]